MEYRYQNRVKIYQNRRKKQLLRIRFAIVMAGICLILILLGSNVINYLKGLQMNDAEQARTFLNISEEQIPTELRDMLERNEETLEFVTNYNNRDEYLNQEIDISNDITAGDVPLFMQWDLRWGYTSYGTDNVGLSGCGPVCMSMAYVYLTGSTDVNPKEMAEFSKEQGYTTEAGTSWSLMTDGAAKLGLTGAEISLNEGTLKSALDRGSVIICSMSPGDFTTTGHFILIKGYEGNNFIVNDPNSRKNSEKQWSYDTLASQMKCLWEISL